MRWRNDMIKKIVLTGPESSGKTTLAKALSKELKGLFVPEYARQYISLLNRPYEKNDLINIAKGQIGFEELSLKNTEKYLICDTDLVTIKIWSIVKYGQCDDYILKEIKNRTYDLYFLCAPDFPWEADPLRENPNDRWELYELYKKELIGYRKKFFELRGTEEKRLKLALEQINKSILGI